MASPPEGFEAVSQGELNDAAFMEPFLDEGLRGRPSMFVQIADGTFHRVLGVEQQGRNDWRFFFEEDIGENIPENDREDSLSLQNLKDYNIEFTLYVNKGRGAPAVSSGHVMTSKMVL